MAKFSTKKLGKDIDKWTSGYYSSGYKNSFKSASNSSFWINEDLSAKTEEGGVDYVKLAGYKRAISNFVRIVTGRTDIPVEYSSGKQSYTDGSKVVISSKLEEKQFDTTVGLALHEGSHIALTDFKHINGLVITSTRAAHEWAVNAGICNGATSDEYDIRMQIKNLINIIEDRRIDRFVYDAAPGYRGYYQSMYDEYFNHKIINKALLENAKTSRSYDDYEFHICNFANPNRQLDCMPGLRDIWNLINLKNISRLNTTTDVALLAIEVWKLIKLNELQGNAQEPKSDDEQDDTQKSDPDASPKGSGESEIEDGDDDDNSMGNGGDPNLDAKGPSSSSGNKLSEKEARELKKAIQQQKDFTNGNIKKKGLSKQDAIKVNAAADSNMHYEEVGDPSEMPRHHYHYKKGKTQCMVIKGLNQKLIDSGLLSHCSDPDAVRKELTRRGRADYIADAIQLGKMLGKRLKTRDEERSVKTLRLDSGRIDRRLINELGFGNDRVFSQIIHQTVTPSLIHISIDASGSMHGTKWTSAISTAVAIAKACSMISSIDVVISLRGCFYASGNGRAIPLMWTVYDSRTDAFNVVKDKFYALHPAGSTPEGLCYEAVMKDIIKSANGKDAYLINLCDGEPIFSNEDIDYSNEYALTHTKKQVDKMRKNGINILSFFISESRYSNGEQNHKFMYGAGATHIDTSNLTLLSKTLNAMFVRPV